MLTYGSYSDVDTGLHCVSTLLVCKDAGVGPRVLLCLRFVQQKRTISEQKQVSVHFGLSLPKVKGVSGSVVVTQDDHRLRGWCESPNQREVLETVRGDTGNGQRVAFFLCYTLWNTL